MQKSKSKPPRMDSSTVRAHCCRIEELFGMPIHAAANLVEAANAFTGYDNLPQATKDSLQIVCDLYGVQLIFHQKGKKMCLSSVFNGTRRYDLNAGMEDHEKFVKKASAYTLEPHAEHFLGNGTPGYYDRLPQYP